MLLESSGTYEGSKVLWQSIDDQHQSINVVKSIWKDGIFGEGVCPINENELIWLTYTSREVFVLDSDTLELKTDRTFPLWK
jgi:glutamine cyclotransferase